MGGQRLENGSNERVIVEDCTYGFCHGSLTCGSGSIHNRNIIFRNSKAYDVCICFGLKCVGYASML